MYILPGHTPWHSFFLKNTQVLPLYLVSPHHFPLRLRETVVMLSLKKRTQLVDDRHMNWPGRATSRLPKHLWHRRTCPHRAWLAANPGQIVRRVGGTLPHTNVDCSVYTNPPSDPGQPALMSKPRFKSRVEGEFSMYFEQHEFALRSFIRRCS